MQGVPAQGVPVQGVPASTESASNELGDIIVTAEKRSESIQRVPLSIVAYGGEALSEAGVQDFSSLAARIPGVSLISAARDAAATPSAALPRWAGNAPTTGFYVDETPILPSGGDGATATIDPDLFDLARVEVLRGPQGTLYGASSMGGTVRLITNQPNLQREEGTVKVEGSDTAHGGGNVRVDGMINIPLIDDRVALRLVATYKDFSGFIDRRIGVWAPNPDAQAGFPAYPVSPAQPTSVVHDVNTDRRLPCARC